MRNLIKLLCLTAILALILTACSGPSPEKIYQQISQSTVEVIVDTEMGQKLGSGFFYAENTVATNYHVIAGMKSGYVKILDGGLYKIESIQGFDANRDIALITVSYTGIPVSIGDKPIDTGATVYTLGSSLGLTGTFAEGVISTSERVVDGYLFIQTSAPISSGNSGGPLINAEGKVIGINTASFSDGQNLNLAVPINALTELDTTKRYSIDEFYEISNPFEALAKYIIEHQNGSYGVSYEKTYTIPELTAAKISVEATYFDTDDFDEWDYAPERYVYLDFNIDSRLSYIITIYPDNTYSVGISQSALYENFYFLDTDDFHLSGDDYRNIDYYKYSSMRWDNTSVLEDKSGYLKEQAYIWMDKLIPTLDSWFKMNGIPCTAGDFGLY